MLNERAGELKELDGRKRLITRPGKSGHAIFGPYAAVGPGRYRVEFSIRLLEPASLNRERDPLIAVADITAGVTLVLFDALVFGSHLTDDGHYIAYFETEQPLSGVEYRIYVNGAEPLSICDEPRVTAVGRDEAVSSYAPLLPLVVEQTGLVRSLFFAGAAISARETHLVVTLAKRSFLANSAQDLRALAARADANRAALEAPQEDGHTAILIVVFATHAPLGKTGQALVGHVMNAVFGGHRHVDCATLAEFRIHWSEHRGRPVLLTADCPDAALSYLLRTSAFPILAFLDAPADAVAYRVDVENQPLGDAIRSFSHVASCLKGVGRAHRRIFGPDCETMRLPEIVEAILGAFGIAYDHDVVANAVGRIAAAENLGFEATVEDLVRRRGGDTLANLAETRFTDAEKSLINSFAANYSPFFRGDDSDAVDWPLELFYLNAKGETGDRFVNLMGGARVIFFGPYLHLPFGAWRAIVQFEVVDNTSGNEFEADVWAVSTSTYLARKQAALPDHGHFKFTLDFINIDPNAVLEIRVRLLKGAIEGRFAVRQVTLYPIPADLLSQTDLERFRSLQLALR